MLSGATLAALLLVASPILACEPDTSIKQRLAAAHADSTVTAVAIVRVEALRQTATPQSWRVTARVTEPLIGTPPLGERLEFERDPSSIPCEYEDPQPPFVGGRYVVYFSPGSDSVQDIWLALSLDEARLLDPKLHRELSVELID